MLNIGVMYGARSVEHDISVLTAVEAMSHLNREKYEVFPIYMAKTGAWYSGQNLTNLASYSGEVTSVKGVKNVTILPQDRVLYERRPRGRLVPLVRLDAVLLCNHGAYGEDGCAQGLLELAQIPYTSCGVAASAIGMDKHFMKRQFAAMGLPILPHRLFERGIPNDAEVEFPCVVKPASLGSSIGISFVRNYEQLVKALEMAFLYDSRVVVEKALTDFREINCAAVFDGETLHVSECEEPKTAGNILSFSDKYLTGDKFTGQAQSEREFPAKIPKELKDEIQRITAEIYRGFSAKGVIRVDYMLKGGELFVNEVNTIPGALSNYLFDFKYNKLLDKLIDSALFCGDEESKLIRNFSSSVITGLSCGKISCLKS